MAQNTARGTAWCKGRHSTADGTAYSTRCSAWHGTQHSAQCGTQHITWPNTAHGPTRHKAQHLAQHSTRHRGCGCHPITCWGGTSPSRATISRSSAVVPSSGTASPTRSERPPSRCSTSVTFSALGTPQRGYEACPRCGGASMHPSLLGTATSCALSSPHMAQMALFLEPDAPSGAGCPLAMRSPGLAHGDGQRDAQEWVEGIALLPAVRARQGGPAHMGTAMARL